MSLRLTKRMKEALECLYRSKGHAEYLTLKTAFALEQRGLVSMPRNPKQRTGGRTFPEYKATLTKEGKAYCLRHYQKMARYDD